VETKEDTTVPERHQVYHYLVIEDAEGQFKFPLNSTTYSIGRNPTNGIVLRSNLVSRQHAIFLRLPIPKASTFVFRIIDGNLQGKRSTNGIFINGERRTSHILAHGDEIVFSSDTRACYQVVYNPSEVRMFGEGMSVVKNDDSADLTSFDSLAMTDGELVSYNEEVLMRLASFPELNPNPILEVNLAGVITYINPAAIQQFPNLQDIGSSHPILEHIFDTVSKLQDGSKDFLVREVEFDGHIYEQFVHLIPGNDLIRSYVTDVTERRRSQEIIQYQASHDLLTGLPNRAHFNDCLTAAMDQAKYTNERLAVVFLDLDRFKLINDSLGHSSGDRLLQEVCKRLRLYLRQGDVIARWGGDEFTLMLRNVTSSEHTAKISERVLKAFEHPFQCGEHELYISTSVGISIYPKDGRDMETLIKNADTAMYRAKNNGRNTFRLYKPNMDESSIRKLALENSLYRALKNDELLVYYQPQVNLGDARIAGVEALIRWQHPTRGILSPDEFICLAEETGLIIPIGYWILRTACAQNRAWQDAGLPYLRLGVNLSAHQFKQPDFVRNLATILADSRLEPQYLDLELTESILMEDVQENIAKLQKLRDMGISLSIDDFGTGYSSLSYLKRMPINVLKIHQSFVKDITTNPNDLAIAISIIHLAHSLNLKVIAEGVETVDQMELLRALKCDEMQGFLFNRPIPPAELAELLVNQTCLW
jgi:diguanylate cyclase (GGDEF)-like protein